MSIKLVQIIICLIICVSPFTTKELTSQICEIEPYKKNLKTRKLDNSIFNNLDSITTLNLQNYELTEIPEEVYNCKNLQFLDLSFNNITVIDKRLATLKELEILYLNKNKLKTIPEELLELNLEVLHLEDNLEAFILPENIYSNRSLNEIYIENLESFNPMFWEMTQLENIRIWNSGLTVVPNKISEFKNLRELCLANNNISKLSSEIFTLTNLEYLSLGNNKLTGISADLANLYNLNYFAIYGNPLNEFEVDLKNMTSLRFLSIWSTNLSDELINELVITYPNIKIYFKKEQLK